MVHGSDLCKILKLDMQDIVFQFFQLSRLKGNLFTVPGVSKSTPFDQTWKRNDKILGLFDFICIFLDLQLNCTYLAFQNSPPKTGDMSSQSRILECT